METFHIETVAFHDPLALMQQPHDTDSSARSPSQFDPMVDEHGPPGPPFACELDFADLVGVMDVVHSSDSDDPLSDSLPQSPTPTLSGDASFVVALFCDGFVCRHWTRKSGWVEGFAQSYDATSRYFLDCLEKERLPDGLLELMDYNGSSSELLAELWDLRAHLTALCPLTSADLPRSAPTLTDAASVDVRRVILKPREQIVLTDTSKLVQTDHPASDQFPQLSNADLEALTNDELASLALGPDADLLQVDESLALLSVDEIPSPTAETSHSLLLPPDDENFGEAAQQSIQKPITPLKFKEEANASESKHHREEMDWDVHQIIAHKRDEDWKIPPWEHTPFLAATNSLISSIESASVRAQHGFRGRDVPTITNDTVPFDWRDNHSQGGDGDWTVCKADQRRSGDEWSGNDIGSRFDLIGDDVTIKDELLQLTPKRRPVKKKKSRATTPSLCDTVLEDSDGLSIGLSLSREGFDWTDVESKTVAKKKKYKVLKPSIDGAKPLPATHLFLSRLKGKRPRNYTIDELDHCSPAWMMMKHMTRFYQAAFMFERRHAQFLQVNIERIMTAEHSEPEPSKLRAGSMTYLAMRLQALNRPDQVIAHSNRKSISQTPTDATQETRFHEPKVSGRRSPSPARVSKRSPRMILAPRSPPPARHPKRSYLTSLNVIATSREVTSPGIPSPLTPRDGASCVGFSFIDSLDGGDYEF